MTDFVFSKQNSLAEQASDFACPHIAGALADARPFLKWAGGKRRLLPSIMASAPKKFSRYLEPFIGGGAVAFLGKFQVEMLLNDANGELINTYRMVQKNLKKLLPSLNAHQMLHSADYYYEIRKQNPQELNETERAARFIYLNKTCFNGLYRVNRHGQFNVPLGRYANPRLFDEANLRSASKLLQRATLSAFDYEKFLLKNARAGDFIYLDPPYAPVSQFSDFKRYTKEQFRENDQQKLAQTFEMLTDMGAYPVLSNSYCDLTLKLYSKHHIEIVKANRNINKNSDGRGAVAEIIVTPKH